MTDLITTANASQTRRATRSAAISDGLAKSESRFIVEPGEMPWTDRQFAELCDRTRFIHDARYYREDWQTARDIAESGPSRRNLEAYLDRVSPALVAEPDQRTTRYMLGLLVSAYPNGRPPDLDAYCETLLHDAMNLGFNPYVVASACRSLRRTCTFLPSVAEFVKAGEAARAELFAGKTVGKRLLAIVDVCSQIAATPEPEHREMRAVPKPACGHAVGAFAR